MLSDPFFWTALLQIIFINILLSGDNAVVIALAARSLPPRERKIAIILGSTGAVVMRILLTLVVAYLLQVPYLKLIGGILLLWIAVKLLIPEAEDGHGEGKETVSLTQACITILIADVVMSLDNVIGVAAAANGHMGLLIIGLAISIPLVIFGSTLMLRLLDKFPVLITLGGALLGWVAGDIGYTDASIGPLTADLPAVTHHVVAAAGAVMVVVVGLGLRRRATARRLAHTVPTSAK